MNDPHNPNVTTDHVADDQPADDLPAVPGYRVQHEIARGGMGRVLGAYDLSLERDVALKVLLPGANAERFVRESRITARLPHPGIPPVHALGTLADGSPFLAMKLIAGRTLAEEMKDADRPRLLQAFTQVCQAVGFAHSKGVIHRDLKPLNVMVGAFGEVQVMDWGLAKELTGRLASDEPRTPEAATVPDTALEPGQTTDHQAAGESTDDQTQAGQVMGTPAFMAPEQARGEPADARADVFALGGILCTILTGQPPFRGKSTLEVIRRAGAADLTEAHARLDACGADAELIALCRRCLSPAPADRPADGQAVADRVTAYLDGVQQRLQTAERERAVALAREAEQRKRRRVQLALAAAVVVLLVGGGAFAWWRDHQANERKATEARLSGERDAEERNRRQQAHQSIDANLKLSAELRKEHRFEEAGLALTDAMNLATEGASDRLAEVQQAIRELAFVVELDGIRFRKWIWVPGATKEGGQFNLHVAPTEYRQAFARHGLDLPGLPPAEAARGIAASAVKAEMVAALDDWALHEPEEGLRNRLLEVARRADPDPWTDRLRDPATWADWKAVKRLAAEVDPNKTATATLIVLSDLMVRHVPKPNTPRPQDFELLDPLPLLAKAHTARPDDFELAFWLAMVQTRPGNKFEQIASYEAARALRPKNVAVWVNLGQELRERGDEDEAVVCFRRAIALDPNAAVAHYSLGNGLMARGENEKAIACFRAAIAISPNFARAHVNLGILLASRGKDDEAIDCYQKAIAANPKLREAHFNLGVAWADRGEVDKSIDCYLKVLEIAPRDAATYNNLGNSLRQKGKRDEAIDNYKKAIALEPKLAVAPLNLGEVLFRLGRIDEAIDSFMKAIALEPKLAKAHFELGNALYARREPEEAIVHLRQAIALEAKNASAYYALGLALDLTGKQKEAIEAWGTAVRLEPRLTFAQYWLGKALLLHGRPGEAVAPLGEAAKGLPAEAAQQLRLSEDLAVAKRLAGLEKRLPALLAGKDRPGDNSARLDVGELCRRQGRYAAAVRFFAEAFVDDSKVAEDLRATHRYRAACSAALAAAGQGEDAAKLDRERERLRKQAIDWLRADLVLLRKLLEGGKPADRAAVGQLRQTWLSDPALASIRSSAALARLPEEERKAFTRLWSDLADGDVGPFIERIAALSPDDQIKEVGKELKKRNPGFDGTLEPTVEKDAVVGLKFTTDHVTDVSPLRALAALRTLEMMGSGGNKGSLADLTPLWRLPLASLVILGNRAVKDLSALEGMPLKRLVLHDAAVTDLTPLKGMPLEGLSLWAGFRGSDLTPLVGMPLKSLSCGGSGQKLDLTPLAGLPLEGLYLNHTRVSDLSPLEGLPLTRLHASNTRVSDLSPLQGMRLQQLHVVNCRVSDLGPLRGMPLNDLEVKGTSVSNWSPIKRLPLKRISCDVRTPSDAIALRSLETLETINDVPAQEFWKSQGK